MVDGGADWRSMMMYLGGSRQMLMMTEYTGRRQMLMMTESAGRRGDADVSDDDDRVSWGRGVVGQR